MGFDFGSFAGGVAQGAQQGMDMYHKAQEYKQRKEQHEFEQKQRARLEAMQEQLQGGPKPNDVNYSGVVAPEDRISAEEFAKQNPGVDVAKFLPGQVVDFGGQQTALPAPAAPNPGAPAPAAPQPTALPQAPQQQYYAFADEGGKTYFTTKAPRYTQEDVAMHQADMMVASGLPEYISQGTQMRNSIVQNQLVRQQVQEGQYRIAAAEAQRAVSQAGILFQQGDMENGIKTLSAAYNTHVPGPYKMQAQPVQGQPDMLQVVHTDAQGQPIFIEKPRPWKNLVAEASAMATPGGFADYLMKAQQMDQQQAELTARSKVWNLQADQIQAALDAGAPAAEVEKMRAEAAAAQAAGGANIAYRDALAAEAREKAELNKQLRALNTEMLAERNPERLAVLTAQRAALEGKVQNTQFYQTLDGNLVRHSPTTGKTELFSGSLKMFLPMGINGDYIAGLPEVKNGNVQFVTTPDGQVGYRSKNMSPTQMATTYEEAVEFMKKGQRPASALPAD